MTEPKINEKAPERLFAWSFNNWEEWGGSVRGHTRGDTNIGPFNEKERSTGSEYVRADLFDALTAERDALRAVLQDIARQKKTDELETEYDAEVASFEDGYDICIDVARKAVAASNNSTPRDETAV